MATVKKRMQCDATCKSIIMGSAPGAGDHHGCPFRHFSTPNLRAKLVAHQVDEFDTEDILELVKGKHYQIACTRYYEVTRARMIGASETLKGGSAESIVGHSGGTNVTKVASQDQIEHPNQFFEQSYQLLQQYKKQSSNQDMEATPLDPTVKGRYAYKKAGGPSVSHDMEM
ncbi:DNA primase large subunit [Podila epigama]|nr:DNA primase large subunit [Podila epigama]